MRVRAGAEEAGYIGQWYLQPGGAGEAPIDLVAGQRVSGVDLVLTRGAYLTVRVVDDRTGALVPEVSADLQSVGGSMLIFPAHAGPRDPLAAAAAGEGTDPAQPSPAGVLGALPTVAPDPAGEVAPDAVGAGGGDGRDEEALEIGPVPPGEYRLRLYPGQRNAAYLPVVWGSATGVGRDGRIRLDPGQRVAATVGLVSGAGPGGQPDGAPSGPCGPSGPPAAGDWPGLWAGFLGPPTAWPS
jgi:hypothetical protein